MNEIEFRHLADNPGVKDCCKNLSNLVVSIEQENLLTARCKLCGCRHRKLFFPTIEMQVQGSQMGE